MDCQSNAKPSEKDHGFALLTTTPFRDAYRKKANETLEDWAQELKKSREKQKALDPVQKHDLRLLQKKEATKRLINETSQDIRLKDAANRSAAKISNETLQESKILKRK
jgi:hypothetical protein